MSAGEFEVMQIAYNPARKELFRAVGTGTLSLNYLKSWRVVAGCISLNFIITLLSFIAFIMVACRRFEFFSSTSLLLLTLASAAISALQLA